MGFSFLLSIVIFLIKNPFWRPSRLQAEGGNNGCRSSAFQFNYYPLTGEYEKCGLVLKWLEKRSNPIPHECKALFVNVRERLSKMLSTVPTPQNF